MPATLSENDVQRLLDNFLRYVKVDTRSDDSSTSSPSTEKQKDLSRMLAEELKALGCDDAEVNEWGYVFATVPANLPDNHPAAGSLHIINLLGVHDRPGADNHLVAKPVCQQFYGLVGCGRIQRGFNNPESGLSQDIAAGSGFLRRDAPGDGNKREIPQLLF